MNEAYLIYDHKVYPVDDESNHATLVCYNYDSFGITDDEYFEINDKFGDCDNYGWEMLNLAIRKGAVRIRNCDWNKRTYIDIKDSSMIDNLFDAVVEHPECFKYQKYLSMLDNPEVEDYPVNDLAQLYDL